MYVVQVQRCLQLTLQNGTTEEVKKIVTTLNETEVPSEDVVGEFTTNVTRTLSSVVFKDYVSLVCRSYFFV